MKTKAEAAVMSPTATKVQCRACSSPAGPEKKRRMAVLMATPKLMLRFCDTESRLLPSLAVSAGSSPRVMVFMEVNWPDMSMPWTRSCTTSSVRGQPGC